MNEYNDNLYEDSNESNHQYQADDVSATTGRLNTGYPNNTDYQSAYRTNPQSTAQGYNGYQQTGYGYQNYSQRTPIQDHPNYSYTKPVKTSKGIGVKGVIAIVLS